MFAGMAELADAHGSGPCGSNTMRVQVSFPARKEAFKSGLLFCYAGDKVKSSNLYPVFLQIDAFFFLTEC